jgi:MFS family permease
MKRGKIVNEDILHRLTQRRSPFMTQDAHASRQVKRRPMNQPTKVACIGLTGLAVAMGAGRFAYTPILPLMVTESALSIGDGSLIASINLAGYLGGALLGIFFGGRNVLMIVSGLMLTCLCLAGMGLTTDWHWWAALRGIAGLASAWSLVGLTAWCLEHLTASDGANRRGLIFSGPGVGIAASGVAVEILHRSGRDASEIWMWLSVAAIAATIWIIREVSAKRVLTDVRSQRSPQTQPMGGSWVSKSLLIGAYSFAGYGYITTATFLPLIANSVKMSDWLYFLLWPAFGCATVIGSILIGIAQPRHNTTLLSGAYIIQSIGVASPLLLKSDAGLIISSLLVGFTFMTIVMLTMHEAKTRYHDASLIAALTAGYAFGQMIGPYTSGLLLKMTGSFSPALTVSSASLMLGSAMTWAERSVWIRSSDQVHKSPSL